MFNVMKKRADGLRKAKGERPLPPPPPPKGGKDDEMMMAPGGKMGAADLGPEPALEPEGIVSPKAPPSERFGGMHHRAAAEHHQKLADHFRSKAGGPPKPKGPPPPTDGADFNEEY